MSDSGSFQEAVRFADFLLRSRVGPRVAKILIFGSVAKGTATADSDVDILIVTVDGNTVAEQIDEAMLYFQGESSAPWRLLRVAWRRCCPPRTTSYTTCFDTGRRSIPFGQTASGTVRSSDETVRLENSRRRFPHR